MPYKIKVGDKVRFLTGKEEGTVVRIESQIIYVMLEPEFEIPCHPADLVLCKADADMKSNFVPKKLSKNALPSKKDKLEPELDLHLSDRQVHKLILNTHDPLTVQLNRLNYTLRIAQDQKVPYMIIIHGVGDGILKKSIYEFLSNKSFVKSLRQADPFKYGQGATIVYFHW